MSDTTTRLTAGERGSTSPTTRWFVNAASMPVVTAIGTGSGRAATELPADAASSGSRARIPLPHVRNDALDRRLCTLRRFALALIYPTPPSSPSTPLRRNRFQGRASQPPPADGCCANRAGVWPVQLPGEVDRCGLASVASVQVRPRMHSLVPVHPDRDPVEEADSAAHFNATGGWSFHMSPS